MNSSALFLLVLIPFIGAAFAALMKAAKVARVWSLLVGYVTFVLALLVAIDAGDGAVSWGADAGNTLAIPGIGFAVRFFCDNISSWLLVMTSFLTPLAIMNTNPALDDEPGSRGYYAWMLVLLGAINGCFVAGDGLLFYFFFELTLVPSLLLIGIWGGPERRKAAGKFFIYTFAGSVFLLIGLVYLGNKAGSFEIARLVAAAQNPQLVSETARSWLALAFLVGFLVKTPVVPLHTWQAQTYAESPTPVTAILAGVMSKLGTYGLIRLTLPIGFVGGANGTLQTWVVVLCLISVVYGGLIAWVQKDMAKIMAFSSVSHLGVLVLAIFSHNTIGLQGAVIYMVAHGLSTAALFFLIGHIQRQTGTRDITQISGLFKRMPIAGTLLVGFTMASIGLPLTGGFVGEFLSLQGVMKGHGFAVTAIAAAGIILGAIYMLNMVAKVGFGPEKVPEGADLKDVSLREVSVLSPLVVAVLLLGVLPTPVLDSFRKDVALIKNPPLAISTTGGAATEADLYPGTK